MDNLDETNKQLIKLLHENAWQTSGALAKALNVSSATVRRRLKKLVQSGAIRAVAIANRDIIDSRSITTLIALNVSHENVDGVIQECVDHPETKWVASATGRFDILVLAEFASTEELSNYLQERLIKIEGVKDSETFVCLSVKKGRQILSID
ncbi:MAG: Lrp/AsnC family transcriptional regulator [Dehalococcoidales bacterium]|nr:Lrp/AsnC family transcriptional regulator [Dehalococcoidales bacterium]